MSKYERLTDDELAALIRRLKLSPLNVDDVLKCLYELQGLRAACKSAFVTLREQPIGRAIDAETMEMSGPQLVIWQAYTVLRDALEGGE